MNLRLLYTINLCVILVKVKPGQPTEKMDEAIIFDWGSEDEPDQVKFIIIYHPKSVV